jgi:hypothetical protein
MAVHMLHGQTMRRLSRTPSAAPFTEMVYLRMRLSARPNAHSHQGRLLQRQSVGGGGITTILMMVTPVTPTMIFALAPTAIDFDGGHYIQVASSSSRYY